jgi:hypothetical protein
VSTLVRSHGLATPLPQIGQVIAALAAAGIFRLRGVLVGSVAYQCYSEMLGLHLAGASIQTSDIDIAQFTNVSFAVQDQISPMLEWLKGIDGSFREVPSLPDHQPAGSYISQGGLRIDFLTPNEGPDTDRSQNLPALQTDAQPLRLLDFLIHEPEQAVVLNGAGVYVRVPSPERFAVHKLIVSVRRRAGEAKRDKDLQQVKILVDALAQKRAVELKQVWEEAYQRGPTWRRLLGSYCRAWRGLNRAHVTSCFASWAGRANSFQTLT